MMYRLFVLDDGEYDNNGCYECGVGPIKAVDDKHPDYVKNLAFALQGIMSELVKNTEFLQLLEHNGFINPEKEKEATDAVKESASTYIATTSTLRRKSLKTLSDYDLNNLISGNYTLVKGIQTSSLKNIPEHKSTYNKLKRQQDKYKKAEAEKKKKEAEARKKRAEKKKQKEIEKAKELLKQEGVLQND